MKKVMLAATDPKTGEVFTRKTHRTYSHVVLVDCDDGTTGAIGWGGKRDLAEKTAAYYRKFIGTINGEGWKAIRIIAVDPQEVR